MAETAVDAVLDLGCRGRELLVEVITLYGDEFRLVLGVLDGHVHNFHCVLVPLQGPQLFCVVAFRISVAVDVLTVVRQSLAAIVHPRARREKVHPRIPEHQVAEAFVGAEVGKY